MIIYSVYVDRRIHIFWYVNMYMIDDENPLLRIFLTRSFYSLLYLTHHLTLGFSKRRNPWRSVKVPWRVPWRGKCSLSFSAVREGPWRYREEVREEKGAWVRNVFFLQSEVVQRDVVLLKILLIVVTVGVLLLIEPVSRWGLEEDMSIESVLQYVYNIFRTVLTGWLVIVVSLVCLRALNTWKVP